MAFGLTLIVKKAAKKATKKVKRKFSVKEWLKDKTFGSVRDIFDLVDYIDNSSAIKQVSSSMVRGIG